MVLPERSILGLRFSGEPVRQAAHECGGMAGGYELVASVPALLFGRLGRHQVTLARGPPDQLAAAGDLEPLGYGLLGFLRVNEGKR